MVVTSMSFCLLMLPNFVTDIVLSLCVSCKESIPSEVVELVKQLEYANAAVNFYLYCLTGIKFRGEFAKVLEAWGFPTSRFKFFEFIGLSTYRQSPPSHTSTLRSPSGTSSTNVEEITDKQDGCKEEKETTTGEGDADGKGKEFDKQSTGGWEAVTLDLIQKSSKETSVSPPSLTSIAEVSEHCTSKEMKAGSTTPKETMAKSMSKAMAAASTSETGATRPTSKDMEAKSTSKDTEARSTSTEMAARSALKEIVTLFATSSTSKDMAARPTTKETAVVPTSKTSSSLPEYSSIFDTVMQTNEDLDLSTLSISQSNVGLKVEVVPSQSEATTYLDAV